MKNFFTLVSALFILTNCQAQKQVLRLNLTTGETYSHRISSAMNNIQSVNGMDMSMKMNLESVINYKVLNSTTAFYEIEVRYADLKMKMEMPNMTQEFDSKKNETKDILSKMMNALQKNHLTMKITKSGEIIEVKNTENFLSAIDEFTDVSSEQRAQMKELISKSYGEKTLRENMKTSLINFPAQAIAIGENWIIKYTIENGIASVGIETTYELKEITPDYILITGISKIESLNKDKYIVQSGMEMRSDMNGTISSTYKINKNTGWIIDVKAGQLIKGTTYIKESDVLPEGMTLPIEITMNTKITAN